MRRAASRTSLEDFAPAKVNLTLRVLARRPDGYHEIESLVAFASDVGDRLTLAIAPGLELSLRGPCANAAGFASDNLVLKVARALADRIPDLTLGHFALAKRLPVAAGLGGGSSDAAAALRLLARANGLRDDDALILEAARATGADVPVCVPRKARIMRGIGELLSEPLALPPLAALLANPGVPLATRDVFARLRLTSQRRAPAGAPANARAALLAFIAEHGNDLERAAIGLQPVIADVLMDLRRLPGCLIAQMSGSGATCFALFPSRRAALSAARHLRASRPNWWVRATVLQ